MNSIFDIIGPCYDWPHLGYLSYLCSLAKMAHLYIWENTPKKVENDLVWVVCENLYSREHGTDHY